MRTTLTGRRLAASRESPRSLSHRAGAGSRRDGCRPSRRARWRPVRTVVRYAHQNLVIHRDLKSSAARECHRHLGHLRMW